jgi:hypothetical protein
LLIGLGLTAGCGPRQEEPLVASSADQAVYAVRYPDALKAVLEDFNKREEEANAVLGEVPSYAQALDNPDWGQVLEVVDAAVVAGRSQAYAERMREVRHVHTFFDEEKDELNRRAGGAAQYAAQQGGCNVQVGGAVAGALQKAVDKQLETRLRERNEAQMILHRYSASLGEKNTATLEEQVDHLSYLSFVVQVELPEAKRRMDEMLEEAEQIQKTADDFIADETEYQKQAGRTDKEKEASAARVTLMKESKAQVASTVQQARTSAEKMQERIDKLRKDFDYIVGALRSELQQRAGK